VSLASRTEAELQAVQVEIEALGGQAASFLTDVSSEAQVISLVRDTVERFGRLDIIVNNAGANVQERSLVETTTQQWDLLMAVNARGPFLLCREAIPYLGQQEGTFIINIASYASVKGYANYAAYCASKHAVMGMTKALAREMQSSGIRVHAICPGGVNTQLVRETRPGVEQSTLMQPEEIADIVLFLVTRRDNAVIDEVLVRRATLTPWA
jgi:NAD(P)-dependent dehydrogenase (short-subunit alcohol dehydrogenase family)